MKDFISYFTEENIVKLLCKYRANEANKRHAKHMIRNVSLHQSTNKVLITDKQKDFKFLQSLFPTRRNWKKLNKYERLSYKDSLSINITRLYKSYEIEKFEIEKRSRPASKWYLNLISFVNQIRFDVDRLPNAFFRINEPDILGIKKDENKEGIIYRPIALYEFRDKIICSLTARYLVNYFETIFKELNCSYAFRPKNAYKVPDHHDCIEEILEYRNQHKNLWVSECDIEKFFDTVQHEYIKNVLDKHTKEVEVKTGVMFDTLAKKVFDLFLESFNFKESILNLNSDWFESKKLPFGKFKWVESELNENFGSDYTKNFKIGVPQGNAISCFIANLILHDVDVKVKQYDKSVFYIRYCDDMILMHPDEKKCVQALEVYMRGIHDSYLLYHKPKKFVNYKNRKESLAFWDKKSKSKLPFFWGDKNTNENNIPWVSFVGYQVDFHNRIRVRKTTLKKETKKQIFETQKIIKALGKLHRHMDVEDKNARLSKDQIVFRLQQRLISMSVGRVTIHNHRKPMDQGFCWTNGFKKLERNSISSKQLRFLDKRRNIQINRIRRELKKVTKPTDNTTFPAELKKIKFGGAYSYYNFLKHK